MKYLLGMAEKYHIVGSYGGHKWHRFWLKVLDAREAFPLSTRLWLARLFEANTSMNRYSKTYIRTYKTSIIILYTVFLVAQTLLLENI
jgi:hypothetical protein